jgi:hypothetical protein
MAMLVLFCGNAVCIMGSKMDHKILSRMNSFKQDLPNESAYSIFLNYIVFGDCYAMNDAKHLHLRDTVAEHFRMRNFHVYPNEVIIVGSAKLGFSIAPDKRYNPFSETSDIDIAIASSQLFDELLQEVFDWTESGSAEALAWPNRAKRIFTDYLLRGWFRPDKLPSATYCELCRDWWEFFEQLPSTGEYGSSKIRAGVYKSWHYLERYHTGSINKCKQDLELREPPEQVLGD